MENISRQNAAEEGQALLMVTLGISFLLGVLGLVVDVGYGYYVKQVAQAAADSAVLAAVAAAAPSSGACGTAVLCNSTPTNCSANPTNPPATNFDSACLYAKANGFTNSSAQTVTISSGTGTPPSAPGVSTTYWVTVTASQQQYLGFLSALGLHGGLIAAQATGAVNAAAGAGGCIYVLDPTGSALNVSGSANISSDCGIYVDSSASNAFVSSGGAKTTASAVDIVGNVNISGGSTVTPTPTTGVSPVADPLANLPPPVFSGCHGGIGKSISATTATLSPDVYCGGITVSGGAHVTFNPGQYILNGGGLNVSGNSIVSGAGVFFYNTSYGYSFGPIIISGGTGVTLTAPASGTYQGILFFQDRTIFASAASTFSGGSLANVSGTIYLPTAQLYFSGGASTSPLTMALVCKELNVSGNAYLAKDPTGALTGMPAISSTALVE
jgi:Flp pilus assembly protein TadG